MRSYLHFFLYLYIYTAFSIHSTAQNLSIQIKGKDSVETRLLTQAIPSKTFNDLSSLKSALDSLELTMQKKGYINIERIAFQKTADTSFLTTYHLKKLFKEIEILNPELLEDYGITKREIKSFSNYTDNNTIKIDFQSIEKVLRDLNFRVSEFGFPFLKLYLDDLKPAGVHKDFLSGVLVFESKEERRISSIVIKGYENFPTSFLKYSLGIKPGSLFQKQKITSQLELIDNLGFVKNLKPPEALFTSQKTDLYLYLEKTPNNLFDGILGFSTNEESNNLELNGYVNLVLSNNLNFGERLDLNYKNDGGQQEQFKVQVELPYLFKSPFGIKAGLEFFKRDSTFSTVEKHLLLNYRFKPKTQVFAGYKDYESTNLLEEELLTNFIVDYTSENVVFGGTYEVPQSDQLFPTKTSLRLENEYGTRKTENSSTNQFKINASLEHIFNLNSTNNIFLRNQTGYLSSDNYFTNELFRFGGINSIRGFDENSIDASLFSTLNTEYRFVLNSNTFIHSIIDLGYFENAVTKIESNIYSFGIGLGVRSKAGLLRLNIANGTFENQSFEFNNTKIHLSLISRF